MCGSRLGIAYLADHPEAVRELVAWFRAEWPDHFAPRSDAEIATDFVACMNRDHMPIALVARLGSKWVGTATLRADSITTHQHLGPWLAAFFVAPRHRRRGIGGMLVAAIEHEARRLGFSALYAGTTDAATLFERAGWTAFKQTPYRGRDVTLLRRELDYNPAPLPEVR